MIQVAKESIMGENGVDLTAVFNTIESSHLTSLDVLHEIYERITFVNNRLAKIEQAMGSDYIDDAGLLYEDTGDAMLAYNIFHPDGNSEH